MPSMLSPLNPFWIFIPVLMLVLLTLIVWVQMYRQRIAEMRRKRILPQHIASTRQANALLEDTTAADNFGNLFEMPVLFYIASIICFATEQVSLVTLGLSGLFVLLRYAHSFIHITYNKVMHRFLAYIASSVVLWVLWIWLAFRLTIQL